MCVNQAPCRKKGVWIRHCRVCQSGTVPEKRCVDPALSCVSIRHRAGKRCVDPALPCVSIRHRAGKKVCGSGTAFTCESGTEQANY